MNYRITPTSVKYYFKLNNSKFEDSEKLSKQIKRVAQYLDTKNALKTNKVETYIGTVNNDFAMDKSTLELTFYFEN